MQLRERVGNKVPKTTVVRTFDLFLGRVKFLLNFNWSFGLLERMILAYYSIQFNLHCCATRIDDCKKNLQNTCILYAEHLIILTRSQDIKQVLCDKAFNLFSVKLKLEVLNEY